jgi:carbonic anhydrase/acetyltransferase-like protein (isoleucine patch superfamily)
MPILSHQGRTPRIDRTARIFEPTTIVGDVEIGAESSVWFQCVIRGDVNSIRIGSRTNIQDLSCLHVTHRKHDLVIGNGVTVGHMCLLHGCRIEDFVLVGMGSTVMDGAVLGEKSLLGAGSLVTPGTIIPSRYLAHGRPARAVRPLKEDELAFLETSAANYVRYMGTY